MLVLLPCFKEVHRFRWWRELPITVSAGESFCGWRAQYEIHTVSRNQDTGAGGRVRCLDAVLLHVVLFVVESDLDFVQLQSALHPCDRCSSKSPAPQQETQNFEEQCWRISGISLSYPSTFFGGTSVTASSLKLPIHHMSWIPGIWHSKNMTGPEQLST